MAEIEREVIEQMKAGSMDAFAEMVRVYQSRVCAFLGGALRNTEVIDDLAQETFIQALKTIDRYDTDKSLCSWLFGIGRNLALNHLRKEKHRRERENKWWTGCEEMGLQVCSASAPEQGEDRLSALTDCVSGLPSTSADLVRGFYYEGMTGDSLAARLGMTANAVRQRLSRIREALHDCVTAKMSTVSR